MTFSEGTPSGSRGSLDPPREGVDWVGGRAHTPQPGTTLTPYPNYNFLQLSPSLRRAARCAGAS
jgi:hypothetical protein